MKKQITIKQLLDMIEKGKQPNKISIYGVECRWDPCKKYYVRASLYGGGIIINIGTNIFSKDRIVEYDEEILDEVEKRYLRGIIAPFRDKINYVRKTLGGHCDRYYIRISYNDEELPFEAFIRLPSFPCSTKMYEKMEEEKPYTIEELGL